MVRLNMLPPVVEWMGRDGRTLFDEARRVNPLASSILMTSCVGAQRLTWTGNYLHAAALLT